MRLALFGSALRVAIGTAVATAAARPLFASGAPRTAAESGAGGRVTMRVDRTWRDADGPAVLIELTPQPGWHLSWSNPGEVGQPPRVQLTLPPTWKQGATRFGTPKVIREGAATAFGFDGTCSLLVSVEPAVTGIESPPTLPPLVTVDASWLVCQEKCERGSALEIKAMDVGKAQPMDAAVEARFPAPMPSGSTLRLMGSDGTGGPFEGVMEFTVPGVDAQGLLLLDLPSAVAPSSTGPFGATTSDGGASFKVSATIRPADIEIDAGQRPDPAASGLRIHGVVLRAGNRALAVDFNVPMSALRTNPSIGVPVTPSRPVDLAAPPQEPTP
ncbi:MAG: protein-disulfide reductase DsbD family protein [Planctomycetota bacterium]|nr:protein-disulfide reductase DsbD family protein [Planctomycetota bacterium]